MGRKGNFGRLRQASPNSFQARFGALIRATREEKGLSLQDVARLVYSDETRITSVSDIERGRHEPKADTISRYCAGLQIEQSKVERLRKGTKLNWPEVISPGISLDRRIVGRDDVVVELHNRLCAATSVAIVPGTVIKGQAGIGKTALAKFYIEKYRYLYRGIWWLNADTRQNIIDGLCGLAQVLELSATGAGREALAKAALVCLHHETEPWLLVYDNTQNHREIRDLRPESGYINMIVTSREGHWPSQYSIQKTPRLPLDKATELLLQECGRHEDSDGAEHLANLLDGLPLALVTAGAWLHDTLNTSFSSYEFRLDEMIQKHPETIEDYPESVFGSITLSIEKLSDDARHMLSIFAFLAPNDIWPGLITAWSKYGDGASNEVKTAFNSISADIKALTQDPMRVDQAFAELHRRSLIERQDGDAYGVHRLTQSVTRLHLHLEAAKVQLSAAAIVAGVYSDSDRNPEYSENWPLCARLGKHVNAIVATTPDSVPLEVILKQAARYLDSQGEYEAALAYTTRLVSSLEKRLPVNDVEIGGALNDRAIQLWRLNRLRDAEQLAAQTATMALRNISIPIERRAIWLSIHGVILGHQGAKLNGTEKVEKYVLARKRYLKALGLSLKASGRGSRVIGLRLYNLAFIRTCQGNFDAAVRLHAAALRVKRKSLEEDDPEIAFGLLGLGAALLESGRVLRPYRGESALALISNSLALRERSFADRPLHPDRIKSAYWLALACLTLQSLNGCHRNSSRVEPLVREYELDLEELREKAEEYARRSRIYESVHSNDA